MSGPGTDASDPPDRLANPSFEADDRGWRTYEYDVTADGPGIVAVGISVVWGTEVTRHLDDVRLD